ncbi:circadian locomoter output cycles protein kaput [Anopheles maculipalpis]|uniref:circadian locomoter output cycles protein kaput n=1 Tax=Anopheles maculipalpis TaxID=1496333 RepID=UPI002158C264|nr:circadian locomoter output cycles protein kaput [Anopheles maculipalpis]
MKMSQLGTVYATKRRRRNGKSIKATPKEGITKSNPSKRHRERLNAELDLLASLLPFEQNILSKLDRLSILRLSVSYLRIKSYFQVVMHKEKGENGLVSHSASDENYRARDFTSYDHSFVVDSDMFLQALNGFIMILTCEGEVFFATHTIESYLGFHQSDIIHQSVYELVHSEDREELQKQLLWNSFLPADLSGIQLSEALVPEKDKLLERSFTVRFRCLLDNTSGFLRLDIRGRVKILHGQNKKNEEPPLALFAFCTPFGPPSLLEIPPKENMFKSKHKLDFSLVSMDHKGKNTLGYSDSELANMGGYDLVHYDDLAYVASAHQELLKTGASGMIAYRYQKKDGAWQWLQTSSRLVYKNSKPDFVICTHRQLMEEEGRDLLGKRTMDFKVSYLDAGISSTYFESDQLIVSSNNSSAPSSPTTSQQRANRRYKTQLRDFLSTCRHKRKLPNQCATEQVSPSVVDYIPGGPPGTAAAAAAVAAAAYSNSINSVYSPAAHFPGTAPDNVYMTGPVHSSNFYPMPDNLFHQYRLQGVSGYYPEYHTSTSASTFVPTNGLIPYDSYGITKEDTMRWHEGTKSYGVGSESGQSHPASNESSQQAEAPSGCASSEASYLVSGFAAAPGTDPRSPHVPKSSCQQGKSVSPHSSEELVDPCSTIDGNATPTKDRLERHTHHGSQPTHHGSQNSQHHHTGAHHQPAHRHTHHHHQQQQPQAQHHHHVQHHSDIQQIHPHMHQHAHPTHRHRNGDGSEELKLGTTKSSVSSSPVRHNEPQRQTVLMWGTSYNNSAISGNDNPHAGSSNGSPSYDYMDSAGNFNLVNLPKSPSVGISISSNDLNSNSINTNTSANGEPTHHLPDPSTNNPNQKHPATCEPPSQTSNETILESIESNPTKTKTLQSADSTGETNAYSGKPSKIYANHSNQQQQPTQLSQATEPLTDGTTVISMDPTNAIPASADTKWYCTDDA